jgi:carboxypeptidase Q
MKRLRPARSILVAAAIAALCGGLPANPAARPETRPSTPGTAAPAEAVDLQMMTRIRDEGLHRSQVLATVGYLCDRIGQRLTGSPELKEANAWTRDRLAAWGLSNAHLESWEFGRGWSFSRAVVTLVAPRQVQLAALPKAWTAGTQGEVRGEAVRITAEKEADLEAYRGKLAGKIVLLDKEQDLAAVARPADARRFTAGALAELAEFKIEDPATTAARQARRQRSQMRTALRKFLVAEKALASIEASGLPWGVIRVQSGGAYKAGEPLAIPGLVMATEPYNRLVRLLGAGVKVELAIDVKARFYDDDKMAYNTIAEIPGGVAPGEVVMVGAHLDSWHAGTGATDNAAGCAVAMEAMRILAALHVRPRRTIRIGLWAGEEQGLLGSQAYVSQHFASWPPPPPDAPPAPPGATPAGPLTLKPDHARLAAYFNVDNGSGKIRGITAQENAAVGPIFAAWLEPFADLGATTVSMRSVGSTDHASFERVGLPGFQFIQDELDYMSHTHHTDADVYDHLEPADLEQASVLLAAFAWDAASRREMLPRKPLPESALATAAPAPGAAVKGAAAGEMRKPAVPPAVPEKPPVLPAAPAKPPAQPVAPEKSLQPAPGSLPAEPASPEPSPAGAAAQNRSPAAIQPPTPGGTPPQGKA